MPLFLSDEEYTRCSHDPSLITQKADAYIRELYNQLETEKAQYDASSITAEQTCSILEQKYVSLKTEFDILQSQHSKLSSDYEERASEVSQIQAEKHHIYLQSIGKDGDIERLSLEATELQKSKSQLLQLIEHKDLEINEKNSSIKSYLDKIVALTDNASAKESRISELEAEIARVQTSIARLSQEKELVERHNLWLNDELTTKVNSLLELRKVHNELEADMSSKLADLERRYNDASSSLKWKDDKVKELESKIEDLQNELCSSKDVAAQTEERLSAELSTVNKLVELYKESSEEWSKKAGELEGVIKALETHSSQVEKDYKERLDRETSIRTEYEKEVSNLKEKLEKCEAELERSRNSDQINLLQMGSFNTKGYGNSNMDVDGNGDNNLMLVPSIPSGISGTALAASLLRDGWSLVKMYEKYQEAVDALRHEQLGRKQSQSILERVLHEIEEKADAIMDERAEHERMVEAYDTLNEKLQLSVSEQNVLEKTIQDLKADLKRHERDYLVAQKENSDLQKQVTVLLKECRDIQLRCGSVDDNLNDVSDPDSVFSDRLLTFKDINGLVEQNVQLRRLVHVLTEQVETKEVELKENYEKELQKHSNETKSKVDAVLSRAEEQAQMIESLHTSVGMYKKLYEEEHKRYISCSQSSDTTMVEVRNSVPLLLEGSHDGINGAQEKAYERIKVLDEEITGLRSEIVTLRSQNNKLNLEATFANEKLERFMKDFDRQREETNGIISRNVEFSQLIVDYQKKIREASEDLHVAEDLSRKLNMEVSVLKREKEILVNSEKRAFEEVRSMSERVHQLQTTLNTIQSAEEVREETRSAQRMNQEDYVKRTEREWAEAKKELQIERDNVRKLTIEHESAMRGSMQRIEEMGKELANALRAVSDANSRALAAEERLSQFEKLKSSEVNDIIAPSSSKNEVDRLKDEIEKLRVEAQSNKDHMLQYRSLANVNETALKQMEESHEIYKVEAEKVKKLLEDDVESLKEQVNKLKDEYTLKAKEAVSAAESQEEALSSSLDDISKLREECNSKVLQIEGLESMMSAMKDNLENEHKKWRTAQDNYERQVILQSETIQELTKTSQELAKVQEKASELERVSAILKIENNELKSKWETEKLVLEEAKNSAEKKFDEINEQNKLLHDQLEALHIKLAETGRGSDPQSSDDGGLQNVVKYLRRSKEIAETEISLLKQERLRLQSQLEGALKAESEAERLLRAERENNRSMHFTEDEFKALQVQVREMNLLRESNVQLREENKHNFEDCQKLRQFTLTARTQVENLESLLGEKQNEVEACKREIEMQKKEMKDLEMKVGELLGKFKDIDPEEYGRMRGEMQQINVKLSDKDVQLEEYRKLVSEKLTVIQRLEQDLSKSKGEIDERESKITGYVQTEATLKTEVEKIKRFAQLYKRRNDTLAKEKDELSKKNLELSKELTDSNTGKKSNVDSASEQLEKDARMQMLERTVEKLRSESRQLEEKDTKIQMLEKTVERLRDEIRIEKAKIQNQNNNESEKQKQAQKSVSDEVEKMKYAAESEAVPPHSGDPSDDVAATTDTPPVTATGEVAATTTVASVASAAQNVKPPVSSKLKIEPRKVGRRLIRPHIVEDQPKGDVDMLKTQSSSARKRSSSSSASEAPEGLNVSDINESDVAPPVIKKSRGSEQPQEGAEVSVTPLTEENFGDENQTMKEDEDVEAGDELAVEDQADLQNEVGEENMNKPTETEVSEDLIKITEATGEAVSDSEEGEMKEGDDQETGEANLVEHQMRSPSPMPVEDEMTEDTLGEMEISSPLLTMEDNEDKNEEGEIEVEETSPESSTEKTNNEGNDEAGSTAEQISNDNVPTTAVVPTPVAEKPPSGVSAVATESIVVTNQESSGPSEVKQDEAVGDGAASRTINLNERARQRAKQRLAGTGTQPSPPITRGRGRILRGPARGGRTGRGGGQSPGSQGM
ncbi:nuclear-pore anchor [Rutidosis leptorrhynchoides]|uniref:nuclear-pore anchor n=1 Tax=Rutidosis leptorrhynchoides TaxID=125765 RepID=UPI003A9A0A33